METPSIASLESGDDRDFFKQGDEESDKEFNKATL